MVVGRDVRETSASFQESLCNGLILEGVNVIDIGLCGTEEMYAAVSNYDACGGLIVTASHNPKNYNGLKMVKSNSQPLEPTREFRKIKQIAEQNSFSTNRPLGTVKNYSS